MEVAEEMEIPSETSEVQTEDFETLLITYLTNILKCQIKPMAFLALRDLVADAPSKWKLYPYIQDKYPNEMFLDFLKKYPNIFIVYPDRTVILTEGNDFAKAYKYKNPQQQKTNRSYDVVDGKDKEEYISNSEGSEDEGEVSSEDDLLPENRSNPDAVGDSQNRTAADDSTASSISDSTVDMFSSEIVQTSDSDANSLSSTSSLDN